MPPRLIPAATRTLAGPAPLDVLAHLCACVPAARSQLAVLHSATGRGRSVIALRPLLTIEPESDSPLDHLSASLASVAIDAPHDLAAWLGYISYDLAREIEHIGARAVDDTRWPLFRFQLFAEYFLFDHVGGTWTLLSAGDGAASRLDAMEALLRASPTSAPSVIPPATLVACLARGDYLARVARVKDYIAAGDIYQANLAQRWTFHTAADPVAIYRRLCAASPAEFSALFIDNHRALVSASPELFLLRRQDHLETRPIKGTRPRDPASPARDSALRDDLLNSPKDKAELAMIVDLLRNDLGRVARYGSVRVTAPRTVEPHPTVWHTTATIEATLRTGASWGDIFRAVCPGGSITGAPKIRAMQIIEELEPHRRGVYCGNIGAIRTNPDGSSDATLNIAIRTIQLLAAPCEAPARAAASSGARTAHVWAGGGIVADSDPALEYEETLHKAAALFRALGVSV